MSTRDAPVRYRHRSCAAAAGTAVRADPSHSRRSGLGGVSATRAQTVEGLGDVAWWRGECSPRQLNICGGGSFVAITIYHPSSFSDPESRAAAEQIGRLALGRL